MEHHKKILIDLLEVFGINIFAFSVWLTNMEIVLKIILTIGSIAYLGWKWYYEYKQKK